jgi:glycosyltransferase involved in cell wall biosynthesis
MRICFITSTPMDVFEGSGTYVGIETLARSLRALGAQVDVVTPRVRFPILTVQRMVFNQWLRFRSRDRYDVTVGFDMDGYTIAGADPSIHVAAIKGVIADELRFESGLTKMTMGLQAACESKHVRRADFVMTTSAYAADQIRVLYGISQLPRVVPEPIDLAAWNGLAPVSAPPSDKFIVLTVCRFYPRKRLPVLLAAADRLRSRIQGLEVRIVGGGPEERRLRGICRERKLEEVVVWRRNISRAELAREYSQCHVFCLPSVQEGFGIVFLEAMANGKPIVAARAGAASEVVQHGLLVEPDNDTELAAAIERLYGEPLVCESLGAAGRAFVRRFDAPVVAKMFLRELEDFIAIKGAALSEIGRSALPDNILGR